MAMANVVCVCGYCGAEFRHKHSCINRTAKESYEEWAREHITVCPKCYGEIKKEEEAERVKKEAEALNLPALEGTPKQVAWAEKIRSEMIDCEHFVITPPNYDIRRIKTEKSAKWFIDNRL